MNENKANWQLFPYLFYDTYKDHFKKVKQTQAGPWTVERRQNAYFASLSDIAS